MPRGAKSADWEYLSTAAKAHVVDNIEVPGIRFTCLNCHGRIDMGSGESKTFTLAINPTALFAPRNSMYLERSAYDDESLTACIRQGETPEGFNKEEKCLPHGDEHHAGKGGKHREK